MTLRGTPIRKEDLLNSTSADRSFRPAIWRLLLLQGLLHGGLPPTLQFQRVSFRTALRALPDWSPGFLDLFHINQFQVPLRFGLTESALFQGLLVLPA